METQTLKITLRISNLDLFIPDSYCSRIFSSSLFLFELDPVIFLPMMINLMSFELEMFFSLLCYVFVMIKIILFIAIPGIQRTTRCNGWKGRPSMWAVCFEKLSFCWVLYLYIEVTETLRSLGIQSDWGPHLIFNPNNTNDLCFESLWGAPFSASQA